MKSKVFTFSNHYVSTLVTSLQMGVSNKKNYITHKKSKVCCSILDVLYEEGFIRGYSILNEKELKIYLRYIDGRPAFSKICIVSKLSKRVYSSFKHLKGTYKKCFLISTSKGIFSTNNSSSVNFSGGEVLCYIE